jgi:phosphoribosylanthranilate isomerase
MALSVKICGMKYPDNLQEVAALSPDYLGFIFYPKSKRYVLEGQEDISLHTPDILQEMDQLSPGIRKVGVFVNEEIRHVVRIATLTDIRYLQLHGDESAEYCEQLKMLDFTIIKAFGIDENFDFTILNEYTDYVDYFLFDTKTPDYGGSGRRFDWSLLRQYNSQIPVFLSGGLDVEDIATIHDLLNVVPVHALDFNSKLEIEPGRKDVEKCREVIEQVRALPV